MTKNLSSRGAMRLGGLCLGSRHREEQSDVAVSASTPVIARREATWRSLPQLPSSRGAKQRGDLNAYLVILSNATACVPLREGSIL